MGSARTSVQPASRRAHGSSSSLASNSLAKSATAAFVSAVMLAHAGADMNPPVPDLKAIARHEPTSFGLGFLAGLVAACFAFVVVRQVTGLIGKCCGRRTSKETPEADKDPRTGPDEPWGKTLPASSVCAEAQATPVCAGVPGQLQALLRQRPASALKADPPSVEQIKFLTDLAKQLGLDLDAVLGLVNTKSEYTAAIKELLHARSAGANSLGASSAGAT
jgi:hypothetical protein